jgi:taurine dioxygenase
MTVTSLELRPLSPALGVEVIGLDLRDPQPEGIRRQVVQAFREHLLVLVRGVALSAAEQRRFAEWFGPIDLRIVGGEIDTPLGEHFISNTRPEGGAPDGPLLRHSDYCFTDRLLPALSLYAEVAPGSGGETVFANAIKAYERLPDALRQRITGLSARHVYDEVSPSTQRYRVATAPPHAPSAVHPVVIEHPVSGRLVLYVNPLMTDSLVGLPPAESDALLDELFTYFDGPEVEYDHSWRLNDVVIWDNIALQHGRRPFPNGTSRSMRRLQVG